MKSRFNRFAVTASFLLTASFCYSAPIFSWETGTEGWAANGSSIATSTTGATDGLQSLAITTPMSSMWSAYPAALGLSVEQRQSIFTNATELKLDVTYPNPGYNSWYGNASVGIVIQGSNLGWTELPTQEIPVDGLPHAVTIPLTVAQAAAMATGNWGQMLLKFTYGNGGSTSSDAVFYVDNLTNTVVVDPAPATSLYWKGNVDGQWTSLNWTSDMAGTAAGGALPTDGSAGIGFAATDAANLTTVLGANQNVKSIVATAGTGPVSIGGTHSLTVGASGIWLDETSGGLSIATTGGVVLSANQLWRNKSTSALNVSSVVSGSGTLTKIGAGPLRLGGNNSYTGGTIIEQGDLALDHANALGGPTASLTLNGGSLDLNGFNVTLGSLTGGAGGIVGTTAVTSSTLTLAAASDFSYATKINEVSGAGQVSLVKSGTGTVASNGAGNFTGAVTINDGIFSASGGWGSAVNTSLGNAQVAGRKITVNSPGVLSFVSNSVFGNNEADTSLLPEIIVNGAELDSMRYNQIGDITLNAGILAQSSSDTGSYQGYQFKGRIKVTGTEYSIITGGTGRGDHLSANTVFEVQNVTGDTSEDLVIYAPLIDQSGDFGSAPGGLTKTGAGTMTISAVNTYTGNTVVSAGTLSLQFPTLSDTGITTVASGATLDLNFEGEDTVAGLVIGGVTKAAGLYRATDANGGDGGTGTPISGLTGSGKLNVIPPASGYTTWSSNVGGQTPANDYNNDGVKNGIAYFMNNTARISLPGVVGGAITWTNGGNIPASAYGTQFVVQTSQNLSTWTAVPSGSLTTNTNSTLTYTLTPGQGKWFVRLVVTPN